MKTIALHHMGLRKSEIGWAFKDEHVLVDEKDVVPLEVNN